MMTEDELLLLAEKARREAVLKSLQDTRIWFDQVVLGATAVLKIFAFQLGMAFFLMSAGLPEALSALIGWLVITPVAFFNPGNFFWRNLFDERGNAAFDAVVEQHTGKK